ncbi:MAG: hypothetical protein IJ175_08645, partial [Clostridia bacterium]|nr:hypothetical protein [Clostridia bacterium]
MDGQRNESETPKRRRRPVTHETAPESSPVSTSTEHTERGQRAATAARVEADFHSAEPEEWRRRPGCFAGIIVLLLLVIAALLAG